MKKVIYLFFILVILVTTAYANCDEIESDAYVVYTITGGEIDEYDFGKEMVINAKTSEEYKFIGYFLPAGVYRVTNLDTQYPVQVTVYVNEIVKPEKWEEFTSSDQRPLLLFVGDSKEMTILDNEFIKVSDGQTIMLELIENITK